jgi:thiaminase/transcriptional activator TenA
VTVAGATGAGFCQLAWDRTARLQAAMLDLPFNRALADGTLSRDRFQFYLAQDTRYLIGFGRALSVASARADSEDDIAFFAGAAQESIVVERELHAGYFQRFGLTDQDVAGIETSPTCLAYTSYLLATAQTGSYQELIAALLPCFWVYHQVGTEILARQSDLSQWDQSQSGANPYRAWIDTYADEGFGEAVATCRRAVDNAAAGTTEAVREKMLAAFTRATEYEWMFWDSAWRLESWPTRQLRD